MSAPAIPALGEKLNLLVAYTVDPPDRDDVVFGIEPGDVGVLGGQGSVSKSWFLGMLAHDLALVGECSTMKTTLAPPKAQSVGYLSAEESLADLQRRFHAFGSHLTSDERERVADLVDVRSLKVSQPLLINRNGELVQETYDQIVEFAIGKRLVILDPWLRLVRADTCDEGMMAAAITTLEQIAIKAKCALVFSHHAGKGQILQGNGASPLALKGSTVLIDLPRWAAMLVRPPEKEAARRVIDRQQYRILAIEKANHVVERHIWFQRRSDGTLAYDAEQTLGPAVAKAIASLGELPSSGRRSDDENEDRLPTLEEYARGKH